MIEKTKSDEIYDLINSGDHVTADGLKDFLETVFFNTTPQQIAQILQPLGNIVTRDEFCAILELLVQKRTTDLEVFNSWDVEKKGYIDRKDIKSMLRSYGLSFKESFIDDMVSAFGTEKICFKDFSGLLCKLARTGPSS